MLNISGFHIKKKKSAFGPFLLCSFYQVPIALICLIKLFWWYTFSNQVPPTPNPTKFSCVAIGTKYFQLRCPHGCPHWLNFIHIILWHYLQWLNFSPQIHVGIGIISPHHTLQSLMSTSVEFSQILCRGDVIRKFVMVERFD